MDLPKIIGEAVIARLATTDTTTDARPTTAAIDAPHGVIVRTYSAGVFFSERISLDGSKAYLTGSRRVWRWVGATELTDLAVHGPRKPAECRISVVSDRLVTEVIEVIPCSAEAARVIAGIKPWTS